MRKTLTTMTLPPTTLAPAMLASLVSSLASAVALAAPAPECPAKAPRVVVERFLSADCEACWQEATPIGATAPFVLDWIVPSPRGSEAPMSIVALPEASERAGRAGSALTSDATLTRRADLPAHPALHVVVRDGPAMNGYIGLQMETRQRGAQPAAPGLAGYIALVERIPAGSEGTAVSRQLVRTLIGPFPLLGLAPGHPATELRATSFPENAKPERLTVVGWVESAEGQVIATANAVFAGCGLPR